MRPGRCVIALHDKDTHFIGICRTGKLGFHNSFLLNRRGNVQHLARLGIGCRIDGPAFFHDLVFRKYDAELNPDRPHFVLCQITDGGNLGTALRACLGFGIKDVAIIRPAVDAFDPHVLRASMGAFYRMNVRTFNNFEEYRALFPEHSLFPFMLDGAKPLDEVAGSHPEKYALVFGNEQTGLPAHFASLGQSVIIPQSNEIDSLNLAVAVSIGAYAFTRPAR